MKAIIKRLNCDCPFCIPYVGKEVTIGVSNGCNELLMFTDGEFEYLAEEAIITEYTTDDLVRIGEAMQAQKLRFVDIGVRL